MTPLVFSAPGLDKRSVCFPSGVSTSLFGGAHGRSIYLSIYQEGALAFQIECSCIRLIAFPARPPTVLAATATVAPVATTVPSATSRTVEHMGRRMMIW